VHDAPGANDLAAERLADARWPRQTPSIGTVPASVFSTSTDTPASLGVHGPGEITMRSGFKAAISATVSSSLRITFTSSPNSAKYCTRL